MDRMMLEAGNSYYPLHLLVSPRLGILDVVNFSQVKERWQVCARSLQERMPSPETARYFRFSAENMANSKTFIASLYRNAFYKIYFRNIFTPTKKDEVRLMLWDNFPEREMNQSYLYEVKPIGEDRVHLWGDIMQIAPEQNGAYDSTYETGSLGEIRSIAGEVSTKWKGSRYTKRLQLTADTLKTREGTELFIINK